jgi:hypothetical protein
VKVCFQGEDAGLPDGGQYGGEDFAFGAADEIEAGLLLDELELRRHAVDGRWLSVNGERAKSRSLGCARDDNFLGWHALAELPDRPKGRPLQERFEDGPLQD